MLDRPISPAVGPREARFSRRDLLSCSLAGLAGLPWLAKSAQAAPFDDPPVFETARYQFTLLEPPMRLPPVNLIDIDGRTRLLSATPGKILLLNFWATWCAACRYDLPLLERFHRVMGDRIAVAAVSTDAAEDRPKIRPFLDALSIRVLPIFLDPDGQLASKSADTGAPISLASGMPATILITPSGRVAGYILGIADWLSADAQKLLAYYVDA